MRIAVIGGGISGNLVARLLWDEHDVHLFESQSYLGGHSHTHDIELFGGRYTVDTGFMVFNHRTYPNFTRLLELLQIPTRASDMSFGVRCERTGLEYQGSDLNGLFAQRVNLVRLRMYRMLADILRFNRLATKAVLTGELEEGQTVGQFLDRHRLGVAFREDYLLPCTGAIWSTRPAQMLDFPAKFLLGFCHNHGLLQLRDRPIWRTIIGGSRQYVAALTAPFREQIRLRCAVRRVTRKADGVELETATGQREAFDQVIFATHANDTLAMLADPSPDERRILGAFPYQENDAVLHTDVRLLPRLQRAWASWNYHKPRDTSQAVTVTYNLSRLQGHATPSPILLTLNRADQIDPQKIISRFTYTHPAYTVDSIAAQRCQQQLNGCRRSYFCGAYWGYGFHEDGVNSALVVARCFGKSLDTWRAASTKAASSTAVTSR